MTIRKKAQQKPELHMSSGFAVPPQTDVLLKKYLVYIVLRVLCIDDIRFVNVSFHWVIDDTYFNFIYFVSVMDVVNESS